MQGRCTKHDFERAEDLCGTCCEEFCAECLVYPFGPKRAPFCIPCAMSAGGVRRGAGNMPSRSRRELKRMEKERRLAFARMREPVSDDAAAAAAVYDPDPMPVTTGGLIGLESAAAFSADAAPRSY